MENIMRVKIKSQLQLESIMYTWFSDNENCLIELLDEDINSSIYFISYKLPNGLVSLSACAGGHTIGNYMSHNDGKGIMEFVKEYCGIVDFDKIRNLYAILKTDKKEIDTCKLNRDDNKRIKKETTPVLVTTLDDAIDMFHRFMDNKDCNKLIFTFKVPMHEYKTMFVLDYNIDKINLYGKPMMSCTYTKMSGFAPIMIDGFLSISNDKEALEDISEFVTQTLVYLFKRCMYVSNEEIDLYIYSNCELI